VVEIFVIPSQAGSVIPTSSSSRSERGNLKYTAHHAGSSNKSCFYWCL